ncbi:MAG: energy-coupling factor transporter transmembrane protein EcfT [Gudongella sp.]|nr:energy-coupling factor transporter transmembrane protein EcfT [Gudongella sp.]
MVERGKLDPRSKLFFVATISSFAVGVSDTRMLLFLFILAALALVYLGTGIYQAVHRLGKLIYVVLALAIVQSVLTDAGEPLIRLMGVTILTDYGIERAAQFLLRVSIIITSSFLILTSTTRDLIQGLLQMKLPYELVFMLSIAAKFLPTLRNEMIHKVMAMELQGIDLKGIRMGKKLKAYRYLLLPVTVNSLLKSRELGVAMEMRGFRAMETRTSFRQLRLEGKDYLFMGATAATVIIAYIIIT